MNALWVLSLYNTLHFFTTDLIEKVSTTYSILRTAFAQKTYLMLEGVSAPYERSAVLTASQCSAVPLWYYSKEVRAFIAWSAGEELVLRNHTRGGKPLSILSMSIMNDENELHDLTDFIGGVTVYHPDGVQPSVAHILAAWSLESKVVVNPLGPYAVQMITEGADSIAVPPDSQEPLNRLTVPEVARDQPEGARDGPEVARDGPEVARDGPEVARDGPEVE